ncbi:VCBS repeat-containing protein [Streptomyces sp. ADI91-18]|uniref:VCBS repeat-containing protein n=1 Tax=Streptomyces sp. ADI91-18 TaxID=1522755 RepID=UPI000F552422|nr:VCBS repeat-containing protein [Streptomyces sp. ADI91-18]
MEIVDRREEATEVFANPDGSLTRRQYSTPVWTRYERLWKKADATVVARADGTVGPAAPTYGLDFSGGGSSPLATMTKGDKSLSLSWPTPLPKPVLESNTALYKSVLPDVDLKVIAQVDGFAEHLVVRTREAAANPALKKIKIGITAKGVTLADDAGDNLTAKDSSGNVVFSAPSPRMWEEPPADTQAATAASPPAAKSPTPTSASDVPEIPGAVPASAPVAADVAGGTLTLTPDPALLANADQFPLIIDPAFGDGYRKKWATVYSGASSQAFPNGAGWNTSLYGTPADEPRVGFNGTGTTRSFFAMNTDGLAGATILDATFSVQETYSWGCDAGVAGETELWAANSIDSTPTWNNNDGYWAYKLDHDHFAHGHPTYCPGVQGHDFSASGIRDYVQKAADNGWSTLAFGLRADSGHERNVNSFKRFQNYPWLEIKYNYKPTVDTAGAYEGNWAPGADGNKSVPCGATIGNSGLVMTAKVTDRDGGTAGGFFTVRNSTGQVVFTDDSWNWSGNTVSVTTPVLPNGSYAWNVYAKDQENTTSAGTDPCSFTVDRDGPAQAVSVTIAGGKPADDPTAVFQARSTARLTLSNTADDLAGFCFAVDHYISVDSTPCEGNTWIPVSPGQHTTTIDAVPTGYPSSKLYVLAFDKAGNHSPMNGAVDTVLLHTTAPSFVAGPGDDPAKPARRDVAGDLTGDGYADLVATDNQGKLRLYPGDGTGAVSGSPQTVGTSGWAGSLITHRGDFTGLTGGDPDGYEDYLVRLANGKLYLYPGNGLGTPWYWNRSEIGRPSTAPDQDWSRTRQIIAGGDIDQKTTAGFEGGNDLVTIECTTDSCADAELWLYSGRSMNGSADQSDPFDIQSRVKIGSGGWKDFTNLALGDVNGDGIKDIVGRRATDGILYLYAGRITNGVYSLSDDPTVYGNGGWEPNSRPHLASPGNIQGTVSTVTHQDPDTGETISARRFQPVPGAEHGDFWATTPADPNYTVRYQSAGGAPATTTCPTGCLLFYPGGRTTHQAPNLVGSGSWDTAITNIF